MFRFLALLIAIQLAACAKLSTNGIQVDTNATKVNGCGWTLYKQCDPRWGSIRLGTSSVNTICTAGCAMSSVSMALNTKGIKEDPQTLNAWLTGHGGYVDQDLIVWNSVHVLGSVSVYATSSSEPIANLKAYVDNCMAVIVNVRDGTHWVLLTGYDAGNDNIWYVNDPGFNQASYDYSGMSNFVIYKF